MKVALCLYGHVGIKSLASTRTDNDVTMESSQAGTDPALGYQHFRAALLDHYDVDVFIHSWSDSWKERLMQLYEPKDCEILPQKIFDVDLKKYGITNSNSIDEWHISDAAKFGYDLLLPSRGSVSVIREEMNREAFRAQSRWWSSKRTIELKSEYEKTNNFKYDMVVLARIDLLFRVKLDLSGVDPKMFYATQRQGRQDIDHALHDLWFMSGTDNMDKFGTLYDNVTDYCIRPTFACRSHIKKVIGDENLVFSLVHDHHYRKA